MKLTWLHFLSLMMHKIYVDYKLSTEDITSVAVFATIVAPSDNYPIDIEIYNEWSEFVSDREISEDNIFDICIDFLKWYEKYGFDFSLVDKWMVEKKTDNDKLSFINIIFDQETRFIDLYISYVETMKM